MVEIRQATVADAIIIRDLAEKIWWPTYSSIISKEQINYMLGLMYDVETITKQITENLQSYIILSDNGIPQGFAAFSPRAENPDVYKLHKLYCLIETKGKGYGKLLLRAVEEAVLAAGEKLLELNVNRNNPAIGFYEKMGFTIAHSEDIHIGNGYEMNDYVMRKELAI